jgi:hypothetical protein
MEQIHLDLKIGSAIPNAYRLSAQQVAKLSGFNLGNLVFRHALRSIVSDLESYRPVSYPELKELVQNRAVSCALISCANWLGTREEDESSNKVRADLIEQIPGRVASFGLGVQASQGAVDIQLGPESKRLAQVLAEKCELLSVRDQLTARTLRSIGVENVCVTGCPSNFINLNANLGSIIAERARRYAEEKSEWSDLRTAVSEFTGGHSEAAQVLGKMFQMIKSVPAFYIAQSPALLPFLFQETDLIPPVYTANVNLTKLELRTLIRSKGLSFSSVDAWLDFSRTCDMSFGMRIHGTMVPLQAGVPSLLIGHDARTSGLASEMGVPMMTPEQFLKVETSKPGALYEYIGVHMEKYDETRMRLAAKLQTFLDSNDISSSVEMLELSTSG